MTTDVHQQRQAARPFDGRRCINCGVRLYEGEVARLVDGAWKRVRFASNATRTGRRADRSAVANQTKPKRHERDAADWEWGIGTADLAIFRSVALGSNPLIARRALVGRGWIEPDADDFVKLALGDSDKRAKP